MPNSIKPDIAQKSVFQQEFIASAERGAPISLAALIHMLIDYHCGKKPHHKWTVFELIYKDLEPAVQQKWGISRLDRVMFNNPQVLGAVLYEYDRRNPSARGKREFAVWAQYSELCSLLSPGHNAPWKNITTSLTKFCEQLNNDCKCLGVGNHDGWAIEPIQKKYQVQAWLLVGAYKLICQVGDNRTGYTYADVNWKNDIPLCNQSGLPDYSKLDCNTVVRLEHLISVLVDYAKADVDQKKTKNFITNDNLPELEKRLLLSMKSQYES
jgi:hypothetical protein